MRSFAVAQIDPLGSDSESAVIAPEYVPAIDGEYELKVFAVFEHRQLGPHLEPIITGVMIINDHVADDITGTQRQDLGMDVGLF